MRFSANLGYLWADLPLPLAVRAAAAAGFDAVECHWPYAEPLADLGAALRDTGLPMLGVNTLPGPAGGFGLAALPGQAGAARVATAQAVAWAAATGARHVHVLAGIAEGSAAQAAYADSLRHACGLAAANGLTVVIEPLNSADVPGYFLRDTRQAAEVIAGLGLPNLALMFDIYHVARTEGRAMERLRAVLPLVGHIQFAAVPDRGPPDHGTLDYAQVFAAIRGMGWNGWLGAEYRPAAGAPVEAGLGWMAAARAAG